MNSIEARSESVERIFQNFYNIPDYQREYVWKKKQVSQLLNDIKTEKDENNDEYFVGSIIICPSQSHSNTFDIIDGQQRITTLFIIFCAVRDILHTLKDANTNAIERLISDEKNRSEGKYSDHLKN